MLLEFKVWGSREWHELAMPMLEDAGFVARDDLRWADPETDGELMGLYFDLPGSDRGEALPAEDVMDLLARIRKVVLEGEAPSIEMAFVPSR